MVSKPLHFVSYTPPEEIDITADQFEKLERVLGRAIPHAARLKIAQCVNGFVSSQYAEASRESWRDVKKRSLRYRKAANAIWHLAYDRQPGATNAARLTGKLFWAHVQPAILNVHRGDLLVERQSRTREGDEDTDRWTAVEGAGVADRLLLSASLQGDFLKEIARNVMDAANIMSAEIEAALSKVNASPRRLPPVSEFIVNLREIAKEYRLPRAVSKDSKTGGEAPFPLFVSKLLLICPKEVRKFSTHPSALAERIKNIQSEQRRRTPD